ncbi:MAG: hypothetical protein GEU28_14485 [Dehalococcoidia bacterium]|nr:hypothetical protein [Dehalococcoidia bacterium]
MGADDPGHGRPQEEPATPSLLAEIDAVFSADPLDAVWRRAGGVLESPLAERLAWRWTMPAETARPQLVLPLQLPEEPLSAPPGRNGSIGGLQRRSAAPQTIGATEKRLLEWLGFHPLLTADELGVLVRAREEPIRSRLAGLVDKGFVDRVEKQAEGEASVEPRFFLTAEGLKLLALRDGVPPRRYVRHGAVAASVPAWPGDGRLRTLLRQFDHTVGVNRFVVRLVDDTRRHGSLVVRWLSASEGAQRFINGGTTHWLRPDAVVDMQWQGELRRLYIEWDRGTMRWPKMKAKLRVYAAYYASQVKGPSAPWTLIVTTAPARETVLWQALDLPFAEAQAPIGRVLTSVASLIDSFGSLGSVWRSRGADARVSLAGFVLLAEMRNQSDGH